MICGVIFISTGFTLKYNTYNIDDKYKKKYKYVCVKYA